MGNVNANSQKLILGFFKFIVGEADKCELHTIKRFISRRSLATELLKMGDYFPIINSTYKKSELIEFFCNLKGLERKRLLKEIPNMIVAIPFDFNLFKIERTAEVGKRYAKFGGKTTEFSVYSILDFLEQLSIKSP